MAQSPPGGGDRKKLRSAVRHSLTRRGAESPQEEQAELREQWALLGADPDQAMAAMADGALEPEPEGDFELSPEEWQGWEVFDAMWTNWIVVAGWGGAYRQENDTMRIDDLRISTRLELGFGVLGLMILAMVAVVWVQVSTMTGLFGDVANARIPRMVVGSAISAVSVAVFALAGWLPLALVAMAGLGFGISTVNVAINMLLQSMAPEALRGRVVSFFSSTRFGFDALGGLVAGLAAAWLGARYTLVLEGAVLAGFVGLLLTWRHRLRAEVVAGHGSGGATGG